MIWQIRLPSSRSWSLSRLLSANEEVSVIGTSTLFALLRVWADEPFWNSPVLTVGSLVCDWVKSPVLLAPENVSEPPVSCGVRATDFFNCFGSLVCDWVNSPVLLAPENVSEPPASCGVRATDFFNCFLGNEKLGNVFCSDLSSISDRSTLLALSLWNLSFACSWIELAFPKY